MAETSRTRPTILRRSCDQCRSRKIGCDRASPCSQCVSSKLHCTHSAVATRTSPPKQRVLVSAQYEQKIDEIAKGVDKIALLLSQNATPTEQAQETGADPTWLPNRGDVTGPAEREAQSPLWDHSVHIVKFIKTIVEDHDPNDGRSQAAEPLLSLRKILRLLEDPMASPCSGFELSKSKASSRMPPSEAVVTVLRWAKDHKGYFGIARIAEVLPLEMFTDICRNVYFAVDDYSEVDLVLANGFLACAFSQYFIASGLHQSREYHKICQKNFREGLARFPLLAPATMESVAALTLGVYNAIETSKATTAWRFVSAASTLCQTLGYHRVATHTNQPLKAAQESLFWSIYKMDKGLSLQLGHTSNIQDSEITLPITDKEPRQRRIGRIQGKVYDQLYSQASSSRSAAERSLSANTLAEELRSIISETQAEISQASVIGNAEDGSDPLRKLYLQCDMVCQTSLLTLVLRAAPWQLDLPGCVSEGCVAVAREVFDIHQKCMAELRNSKRSIMVTQYINWAIVHIPFIPFSILFTHAVQFLDIADLERLDAFAASLKPDTVEDQESITHPHRLYELLCQAARIYIDSRISSLPGETPLLQEQVDMFGVSTTGLGETESEHPLSSNSQPFELNDWYYHSQQLMHLLNGDFLI